MKENNNNKNIIHRTEQLIADLYKGNYKRVINKCASNVLLNCNYIYTTGIMNNIEINRLNSIIQPEQIIKIKRIKCCVRCINDSEYIVVCKYIICCDSANISKNYMAHFSVLWVDNIVQYIQINSELSLGNERKILSVNESVYNLYESNILYIETYKNHIIWHYGNVLIETIDTLKNIENTLSKDFIRIHRSYIVNKNHIFIIQRCSVIMDNGDELPIPYKKYTEVKYRLIN